MRLLVALALAGCAEAGPRPERVRLSALDPGGACVALAPVEVHAGRGDERIADALAEFAAERGADLVVLQSFAVADDDEVIARARLYRCGCDECALSRASRRNRIAWRRRRRARSPSGARRRSRRAGGCCA